MIKLKRKSNDNGYYYTIVYECEEFAQYCGFLSKGEDYWYFVPDKANDLKLSPKFLSSLAEEIIQLNKKSDEERIGF